jgi:hypothetical protein
MVEWAQSIGWEQWVGLAVLLAFAALVGHLRRKGFEANMKDEAEGRYGRAQDSRIDEDE